jgi:hypothetical protein
VCCLMPGEVSREQTQVHLSGGTAPEWNECMDNRLQIKFLDSCTHLSVQVSHHFDLHTILICKTPRYGTQT